MIGDSTDDQDLMDLLTWKGEEIGEKNIVEESEGNRKMVGDTFSPSPSTLTNCTLFSPPSSEEAVSGMGRKAAHSTSGGYSDFSNADADLFPFLDDHLIRDAAANSALQTSSGCSAPTLNLPEEISSALYPHQQEGVQWLFQRHCHSRGALLADEMGLGKTVQVCAFLGQMFRDQRIQSSILVVPVTLISFWLEMLSRWGGLGIATATSFSAAGSSNTSNRDKKKSNANVDPKSEKMAIGGGDTISSSPTLSPSPTTSFHKGREEKEVVVVIQGDTKPKREAKWRRLALCASKASSGGGGGGGSTSCLVLTSYNVIRQDVPTTPSVRHAIVDYLILDESHQIKDSTSSVCQSVFELSARHRLALSGTPVMNSFEDLWSLFRFLDGSRSSGVTASAGAATTIEATSSSQKAKHTSDTDSPEIPAGAGSRVVPNRVMRSIEEKKRGKAVCSSSPSRAAFRAISRSILRGNERDATVMERHTADKELTQLQAVMDRFSLRREKCKVWAANPSLTTETDGNGAQRNDPPSAGGVHFSSSEATVANTSSLFASTPPPQQEGITQKRARETSFPLFSSSLSGTSLNRTPQNLFSCQKHDMTVWISLTDLQRQEYDTVLQMKAEATIKAMERKKHTKDELHRGPAISPVLPPHFCFPEDLTDDVNREQTQADNVEDSSHGNAASTLFTERTLDPMEAMERVVSIHAPSINTGASTTCNSSSSSSSRTRGISPSPSSPPPPKSESGALGLLSLLRDVCQHPWLHLREDSFSAALGQLHSPPCDALGPIESGSKLLVALTLIQQHLRGRHSEEEKEVPLSKEGCEHENGIDPESPRRQNGSKAVGKVLVFSQSKRMLRLLGALLDEAKIPFLRLDGEVKADQRAALVHRFNSDPEDDGGEEGEGEERRKKKKKSDSVHEGRGGVEHAPVQESASWMDFLKRRVGRSHVSPSPSAPSPLVALLSTQVGGTGLTFHTSSCVILLDPSWNPAVDNQCVDRVHRIGQKYKEVFIYRLVTCGTVEEKMYRNQIFKMTAAMQSICCVPPSSSSVSEEMRTSPTTPTIADKTRSRDTKEKREENRVKKSGAYPSNEVKSKGESPKLISSPWKGNDDVPQPLLLSTPKQEEEEERLVSHSTTSPPSASERNCGQPHPTEGAEKKIRSRRETSGASSAVEAERHPRREKQEKFFRYFTRIQLRNMFDRGEYDHSETAVHIENLWPSRDMPLVLPSCSPEEPSSCVTVKGSTEEERKENMQRCMDDGTKTIPSRRGVPHSIHLSLLNIPHVVDVNSNDPAILFGEEEERENV